MAHARTLSSPTDLLGVRVPDETPVRLLRALEAGLPRRALAQFKLRTRLADADLAQLLRVGERTLSRVRSGASSRLPADLSERLYALAAVFAEADQVFGDHETALGWIGEPQAGFGGAAPRELLASELGRQQVSALLKRIEHGMLA